jgi:biotin transport system substrate-specific component
MLVPARPVTLAEAIFPSLPSNINIAILGRTIPASFLRDVSLIVSFAFFAAVVAQIAIRIPTTTVPITGQTFAVLLTGATLGSRRGALSMLVYMMFGMFLMPVFAPSSSIMAEKTIHFILPWSGTEGLVWDLSSGGYIVGFILGSYLVGLLAERGWDRLSRVPLAMSIGTISIYVIGLPWLAFFIHQGIVIPGTELTYYDAIAGNGVVDKTLKGGLYPFIGGDAIKVLLAAMVLPGAWWLVNLRKRHR